LFGIPVSCHIFHISSPQAQKEPKKGGEEGKGKGKKMRNGRERGEVSELNVPFESKFLFLVPHYNQITVTNSPLTLIIQQHPSPFVIHP
jgi:hypothetical protein